MKVLLTGGAGYIGSHTAIELLNEEIEIVIVDNFSNSKPEVIEKIKKITKKNLKFYEGDVCSKNILRTIFEEEKIDSVIHFAGLKAVSESVSKPIDYYQNNLISTLSLLEVMREYNCKKLVFSSSATVYGLPKTLPITENFPLSTTNPYGTTKLMIENILQDVFVSDNSWRISILRYFNPIGSHESGLIGEDPNGIPNNLMPYILKVAINELPELNVFGNDYNTHDGTGVRDYIHVVDLAKGHLKALNYLNNNEGIEVFNLGTGKGYSVLDVTNTFSKVNDIEVKYVIKERRPGDVAACYADVKKAFEKINWKANKSLEDMCKDAYNFYKNKNN